jgi:uncharacterized protein (DUF427 family)
MMPTRTEAERKQFCFEKKNQKTFARFGYVPVATRAGMQEVVMKAVWNGVVIAESGDIVTVEGNAYFPAASLNKDYIKPSEHHTACPWKGTASYYTLEVNGKQNQDAAWFYPEPKDAAKNITNRVAFWKGVTVS